MLFDKWYQVKNITLKMSKLIDKVLHAAIILISEQMV